MPAQVSTAATIAVLRGLDVDTATIAGLLDGAIDVAAVAERERERLARVEQQHRDVVDVLGSLGGSRAAPEPQLRDAEAFSMIGTSVRVPVADEITMVGVLFDRLFEALEAHGLAHDGDGTCVIRSSDRDDLLLDLGVRVPDSIGAVDGYARIDVAGGPTAVLVHDGPLTSLPLGHARLASCALERRWRPAGPARETYLGSLTDQRTEIALPVLVSG